MNKTLKREKENKKRYLSYLAIWTVAKKKQAK